MSEIEKNYGLAWKKIDLHVHTPASLEDLIDKSIGPEQIVDKAKELDLDAICISDHNTGLWVDKIKAAAQGKSIGSLVTNLNRLGILTRHGKPWTRQQILKILRNPIYIGKAYWGKRERRNGRVVTKKRVEEGILIPIAPMVSEEIFQKVQQQLDKNRSVSPRNTKLIYTLQHLLRCRGCGKRLPIPKPFQ